MKEDLLIRQFESDGACVIPAVLQTNEVVQLRQELERAIAEDLEDRPGAFDRGMVHNCLLRGRAMADLLDHPVFNHWTRKLLHPHCIIYAYQSSSLPAGEGNYGSRVHVDCPRFIPGYLTNLGVIFPLDDFTEDNGATWYLPGSHLREALPEEEQFRGAARRILARAGDMILFHARLAHAAGVNQTARTRHSLTINLCRHYMKQRFDLPRMVPQTLLATLGEDARRLIGMNARVPASLDEFYLPEEQRLYRGGQE